MSTILFPNFGAEENDALPSTSQPLIFAHLQHAWSRALAIAAARGLEAPGLVAWLNTPLAQRAADARGLRLFGADVDVVREVHDKGFCARVVEELGLLPPALAGRVLVLGPDELTPERSARFAGLVAKPRFSTSGRGRVQIGAAGLTARTCDKLKARGGAVIEPWLPRQLDWSTQWWVGDDGVRWLGTTRALQQENGVWRGAEMTIADDGTVTSGHPLERQLVELSQPVVAAAVARGFRGACGVDLFSFTVAPAASSPEPGGPPGTQLRVCELNARFTAGFVAVMLAQASGARPGQQVSWWLGADPEVGAPAPGGSQPTKP